MPELPEVETVRRGISPYIKERKIQSVILRRPNLRWPIPSAITELSPGQIITDVQRRSKYLRLLLENGEIIIHLGMSGKLTWVTHDTPLKKHDHADWVFEHGRLRYNDPRRFGAILWQDASTPCPQLQQLGPEPLSRQFHHRYLHAALQRSQTAIKIRIMDAKVVVGVGNIYASEALFHAGIHPCTSSQHLSEPEAAALTTAIKKTLKRAIASGGTTLKDFANGDGKPGYFQQKLWVYGRDGQACRRCHSLIDKITQGGRASYFCPQCQPTN
jgi:formamidopyrimidine-DNA glycosylase